jgi:hypothetical protein
MAEIVVSLPYTVVAPAGREYYVSVAGESRTDGEWEGWLEFVPLDESDALLTPTETTQSNRAALEHWAEALSETYVQGAFRRAVAATTDRVPPRVAARRSAPAAAINASVDLPDPFELFQQHPETMRSRLGAWPRATLLHIITGFDLNPAGKDLSWLSDQQLVTFIVTAVEAQLSAGTRSE